MDRSPAVPQQRRVGSSSRGGGCCCLPHTGEAGTASCQQRRACSVGRGARCCVTRWLRRTGAPCAHRPSTTAKEETVLTPLPAGRGLRAAERWKSSHWRRSVACTGEKFSRFRPAVGCRACAWRPAAGTAADTPRHSTSSAGCWLWCRRRGWHRMPARGRRPFRDQSEGAGPVVRHLRAATGARAVDLPVTAEGLQHAH